MSATEQTTLPPICFTGGMPRYLFNLTGGTTVQDSDGEECATIDEAKAVAIQTAREISRNKPLPEVAGLHVSVSDENGYEVFRTPLAGPP